MIDKELRARVLKAKEVHNRGGTCSDCPYFEWVNEDPGDDCIEHFLNDLQKNLDNNKGRWLLHYNPTENDYYAVYATAKCSECGAPFFGKAGEWFGDAEDGTKLFSGFMCGFSNKSTLAETTIMINAMKYSKGKMPKFCSNCGTEMEDCNVHEY